MNISITIGYYLVFICLGMVMGALGPTLPFLAQNTGTSVSAISVLFMARSFGYLVGSFQGGRLLDRFAGHPLMMGALFLLGLTQLFIPLISWLGLLVICIFIMGLTAAMIDVGGNTLIVWLHREKVGPYFNGLHFFWGVGAFFSPIIIVQLIPKNNGLISAYWILAGLTLPGIIWLGFLKSPKVEFHSDRDTAEKKPIYHVVLILIMLLFFLYVGVEVGFGGWIFTYTITLQLATEKSAAILTSFFWAALTTGRLITIPLAIRFSPSRLLMGNYSGCLVALGIILIGTNSIHLLWVGTILLGLGMAAIFPTLLSLAQQFLPASGKITRWFFISASFGGMTIPWSIGQFFDICGPQITMMILLVDVSCASLIFAGLIIYTRKLTTVNLQLRVPGNCTNLKKI